MDWFAKLYFAQQKGKSVSKIFSTVRVCREPKQYVLLNLCVHSAFGSFCFVDTEWRCLVAGRGLSLLYYLCSLRILMDAPYQSKL